jgi:hypothetical protein
MPPNADTDVEETTSCDIYEIISELKDLNMEISMIDVIIINCSNQVLREE